MSAASPADHSAPPTMPAAPHGCPAAYSRLTRSLPARCPSSRKAFANGGDSEISPGLLAPCRRYDPAQSPFRIRLDVMWSFQPIPQLFQPRRFAAQIRLVDRREIFVLGDKHKDLRFARLREFLHRLEHAVEDAEGQRHIASVRHVGAQSVESDMPRPAEFPLLEIHLHRHRFDRKRSHNMRGGFQVPIHIDLGMERLCNRLRECRHCSSPILAQQVRQ